MLKGGKRVSGEEESNEQGQDQLKGRQELGGRMVDRERVEKKRVVSKEKDQRKTGRGWKRRE